MQVSTKKARIERAQIKKRVKVLVKHLLAKIAPLFKTAATTVSLFPPHLREWGYSVACHVHFCADGRSSFVREAKTNSSVNTDLNPTQ
jgi:hypothetical protein